MRYTVIAIIDEEKFKNIEVSARNRDKAEIIAKTLLRSKYVGSINIIRTEETKVWNKIVKAVLKS